MNKGVVKNLSAASRHSVAMTAEQLRTELINSNTLPFDEGILQNVQTGVDIGSSHKGKVQIYHDTPYAARLYYHPEYNFSTETNINARGEWWEPWLTGNKKNRASQLFRKFYKKLTGV